MRLTSSPVLVVVVVVAVVAMGCSRSEPTAPPKPATASPSAAMPSWTPVASLPRSARPSRELMKDHFTAVLHVRDALIVGNLELAKWNASYLAQREPDPAVASWSMYVANLRAHASSVADATTLDAAAAASTGLALECGRCHAANGVTPVFPAGVEPAAASGHRPHMLRHQWALERMWDGLIGPSEARWNEGATELAEAPLGQEEIFATATAVPAIAKLATDVHALGADGRKATAWTERAAIYGQLLTRCAACHAAIPATGRLHAEGPSSATPKPR